MDWVFVWAIIGITPKHKIKTEFANRIEDFFIITKLHNYSRIQIQSQSVKSNSAFRPGENAGVWIKHNNILYAVSEVKWNADFQVFLFIAFADNLDYRIGNFFDGLVGFSRVLQKTEMSGRFNEPSGNWI